ncbi:MFS transporter [Bacteroides sp.]|uniref:MFS transporter n=1 Tax=Bacteroides sp. TaxID=29523 RepID=UPI002FC768DF
MFKQLIQFYKASPAKPCSEEFSSRDKRLLRLFQWSTFLSATIGYGMYYVCRLSLNVVKKTIVDEGVFSETELGIIGSVLFFTYAIGKFTNGFLADRSNINRFMTTGLLVTAVINLCLGFTPSFILFAILWGISGWFQSMGAASCVVGLSRWFTDKERGTYYGFWSASHNIGEALTFIIVASIVSVLGWRYGFLGAGVVGLIGTLVIWRFFHDSPQSKGLPAVNLPTANTSQNTVDAADFNRAQRAVLRNPAVWILALSSAFMYISRYAVNSWGVFYLEAQKGYSTLDASLIISISSVCGIIGTVFSGVISDRFFGGRRNVPALIFGLMNVVALCLFLLAPGVHFWVDVLAMILFGLGIGVLICFLGGLMAVDIAPRSASGAALGVVGVASYIGAGLQDVMSGVLIEGNKTVVNGVERYDFTYINFFWIGAALLSVLLALLVWNTKPYKGQDE